MSKLNDAADKLAEIIADYRSGEVATPDRDHVIKWVSQFDEPVRAPMIEELCHVLRHTYLSKSDAKKFLRGVAQTKDLVGDEPCKFWSMANIMDLQIGGSSQTEVRELFGEVLKKKCGFGLDGTGKGAETFIYLDDGVFTGNRVRRDLEAWLPTAPQTSQVHVIAFADHTNNYFARGKLDDAIKASGKDVKVKWWHLIQLEDRKTYTDNSDVLRPASIPAVELVKQYVEGMRYKPHLRTPGKTGSLGIFSSEEGRNLLEQEFLKAGVKIRSECPLLGASKRPLGHSSLETLGFGSTIVTFRNCPNNAPLALWAGDPWYPLFPRKTNTQSSFEKSVAEWG